MLSFDELAGTLRTTKDRVLQGVARSPGGSSPAESPGVRTPEAKTPKSPKEEEEDTLEPKEDSSPTPEAVVQSGKTEKSPPAPLKVQQIDAPAVDNQDSILSPIRRMDIAKEANEDIITSPTSTRSTRSSRSSKFLEIVLRPDSLTQLVQVLNSSYDVSCLLYSYLSPIDIICFHAAANLPPSRIGRFSSSGKLDITSYLKRAEISDPRRFLQDLQDTNTAFITGDLFEIFGLPVPKTWWMSALTFADHEDTSKNPGELNWDALPNYLAEHRFETNRKNYPITHFSTPSSPDDIDAFVRCWLDGKHHLSRAITVIYRGVLRVIVRLRDDYHSPTDISREAEFSTEGKLAMSVPYASDHDVFSLGQSPLRPTPLSHNTPLDPFGCEYCRGANNKLPMCDLAHELWRLHEVFKGVEVYATD